MKLRYFIPSVLAVVAAMFTSCSDDNDPTYLDNLRVSSSYVAINQNGGSTSIDVNATESWSVDAESVPAWLTISPAQGGAGQTSVSFSAESSLDGRTAEVLFNCGGKTQRINVIQGLATVSPATCAEVIAGPDSKNYRVTGTVKSIANTTYGNWYLVDETGEVYIYGTLDKKGAEKNFLSLGIDVGDVVTVEGPKTTYNGTVELVNVTVLSIKKSLIKIESGGSAAFDANGGDFMVQLTVAGDGPYIDIDDAGKSWVGITSIEKTDTTTNVFFHVAANQEESARTSNIEFKSTSGKTVSTVSASVSQMGLSGTLTNPFSVEDAIAYCQTLSGETANDFFVKGKISKIEVDKNGVSQEFGSYGNATFWISSDGNFNDDLTKDFECYRVLWLGNQKWAEGNAQISVGDEVIICGKLTLYKGTAETSGNKAYIYSINGVTTDVNGIGSLAAPFNIAGAMNCIDNGWTGDVFVQGIVSKFANNGEFGAKYGNGTFWISDDGTFNDDLTKDFEAYRVLWLGNKKWEEGDDQLHVGDKVILHGQLTKYGSTYETNQNKAYVYEVSHLAQ
ncbi:MAG: DNA-binding protein [Prevotella sp.]|nr:DNA-binding protein [Prevotella sp.]